MLSRVLVVTLLVCAHPSNVRADLPSTRVGTDGSVMVLVPAGEFLMGTALDREDATPPHRRDLPAFYIDRTEVTTEQYAKFVNQTGTVPPPDWVKAEGTYKAPDGRDKLPITNISWFDAMRYAIWAGKRLPTEPEWEKAARGTAGRLFPWGNVDDPARRHMADKNVSSTFHGVGPVGRFPEGASPYGCLDMSGNAWEWTADWYEKYPGTSARSVHFGKQFKVMRGGSGLGFYGVANTGTCVQRARLAPYGAYDSLGFRCAVDADPARPAYDARQVLQEAEDQLQGTLKPPVQLAYEKEFEEYRKIGRVPLRVTGQPGQTGHVRTGFPLPQGLMHDPAGMGLHDGAGASVPVQTSVLTRWGDGSVRWALLDFVGQSDSRYEVVLDSKGTQPKPRASLQIEEDDTQIGVRTGAVYFAVRRDGLAEVTRGDGHGTPQLGRMLLELRTASPREGMVYVIRDEGKMVVEERGPLHCVIRVQGDLATPAGEPSAFRCDLRIHATAGSSRLNLLLTVSHHAERRLPLETPAPVVNVADLVFGFVRPGKTAQFTLGTEQGSVTLLADEPVELLQPDDLRYVIGPPGQTLPALTGTEVNKPVEYLGEAKLATRPEERASASEADERKGTRAPGWMALHSDAGAVVLGVRHFWQNCPKALVATPETIGVRLWAGAEPFEWEAGLAKTHEIVIDLVGAAGAEENAGSQVSASPGAQVPDSALTVQLDPLRAVIAPAWTCGTAAAGAIIPRTTESLETFPYWEAWRETDMWHWANAMPAGFRDFGDGYMGGPYKGKNAFQDLEYDVPLNYLFQFIRTGQPWYLQAAEVMARHQADVDIDNFTGRQWKHSPQHTTTEAEFGHVFCRGLLLHHVLTGERRSLEMARRIGDWMAPMVEKGQGVGNERQIGWSLYALTGLYEVTQEPRYLQAAESLCRRLVAGQSPTGKFDIRWDNRIAFFNGIAMNGMLTVAELTGDPQLTEAVMRVARRTLGFYPEYATRTLNAFCWALEETDDPRYLDALQRTWNATMEFLMDRNVESEETHAWKFPRFAARYRLFSMFETQTAGRRTALPDPATWRAVRLKNPSATVQLRSTGDRPAPVLVIREGLDEGIIELLDSRGQVVRTAELLDTGRFFEAFAFELPAGTTACALRLTSRKAFAWQVQHDAGSQLVVVDTVGEQLPHIVPRAFGFLREGDGQVTVRFEAVGEGFHSATLYDPVGRPVSAVRHFIDFGDVNRYEIELKTAVTGDPVGWSLELCNLKVLSVEGLLPYYAASVADLFNPER